MKDCRTLWRYFRLDTPTFLYGMRLGEEIEVEIETRENINC